jgi:Ca2+-binding RTX toxin-like protein
MRRPVLLLASIISAVLLASGAALAGPIDCPTNADCYGTEGDDELVGTDGRNFIFARGGNDTLKGYGRVDRLLGEEGNDELFGDDGEDTLNGGFGTDTLNGGADVDHLRGGPGTDTLIGGDDTSDHYDFYGRWGDDTIVDTRGFVYFFKVTTELRIELSPDSESIPEVRDEGGANTVNWDNNFLVDSISDGEVNDTIRGSDAADIINAYQGGKDTIHARWGNDFVYAVDGAPDEIDCGAGTDILHYDRRRDTIINDSCEELHPEPPL